MSCPEIGALYQHMTTDMRHKLNAYHTSLQSRYGDPRVYAQQQEAMARDRAAVQHEKSRKTALLLEDAYQRQAKRNRDLHASRIKHQVDRTSSTPPESAAPSRRRTVRPQASVTEPSDQVPTSETRQDPQTCRQTE